MGGFGHEPAVQAEEECTLTSARNARYGMVLFLFYFAFYAGFVLLNGFYPSVMDSVPCWGVNLAILYGFGLILVAILLSLIYSWLCRNPVQATLPKDAQP